MMNWPQQIQQTNAQIDRDTDDASVLLVIARELWLEKALAIGGGLGFVIGWLAASVLGAFGFAILAGFFIFAAYGLLRMVAWLIPAPFAWLARRLGYAS